MLGAHKSIERTESRGGIEASFALSEGFWCPLPRSSQSFGDVRYLMAEITREMVIDAARRAEMEAAGPTSRADFERLTGISQYHIYRLFPEGGWSEVKRLGDLQRHPKDNEPLTDEELLDEFHRVASELGQIPTWPVFANRAAVSADVVRRRFGGLQGTLRRYSAWLTEHHPDSALLDDLQAKSKHELPPPPAASPTLLQPGAWDRGDGPMFGPPIDFRGLRHAPINEQGVVFLFGMVSYELGFIVEAVHAAYPDCEAKRCVDRRSERWQRVRIEFELRSSGFRSHGHDPSDCDVIVCWEHDWPDWPLEVVELRRVVNDLQG